MLWLILAVSACLPGETFGFPDDQLTLDLRKLKNLEWAAEPIDPEPFDTSARCYGRFGALDLELTLRRDALTNTEWMPHHVLNSLQIEMRKTDPDFFFPLRVAVPSNAGKRPYLLAGIDNPPRGSDSRRALVALCGVTDTAKYVIEVRVAGSLSDRDIDTITAWIGGALSYGGELRDPDWTDAELDELWRSVAPDEVADDLQVHRTKHYVILTSADIGKDFSKTMEGCYELLQDVFPVEELKGYRLLPVVLLRSKGQYINSYLKINEGSTHEQASRTGGSCEGEYYVTYYESTEISDHIYLAAQQFVRFRHWLSDGNTWFRVGFGEYLQQPPSERGEFAREVEKQRFVPLTDFMLMPSFSVTSGDRDEFGQSTATNLYDQAAALVEFLVESKPTRKRSGDFFKQAGNVIRTDRANLERVLRDVYDTDIPGLEAEFVEYWRKRPPSKK